MLKILEWIIKIRSEQKDRRIPADAEYDAVNF